MTLIPGKDLEQVTQEPQKVIDLDELGRRMDVLGQQMDWLCENLASLFMFVNQVGSSGGGVRGLMKAMKNTPELNVEDKDD